MKKMVVGCYIPRAKRAAKQALCGVLLVVGALGASVAQAADGAFTFKIVEGERAVYLFAAKVENMIKYSDDLTSFAVNTDKVSAQVQDDNITIKAVFLKPNNETKGFMKLELPATEE